MYGLTTNKFDLHMRTGNTSMRRESPSKSNLYHHEKAGAAMRTSSMLDLTPQLKKNGQLNKTSMKSRNMRATLNSFKHETINFNE